MKSFLFCTSSVDNQSTNHHVSRYKRWINFYQSKLSEFGADRMFLIDDAGQGYQDDFNFYKDELPSQLSSNINFFRFNNKLGRGSLISFPGWWRSFLFSIEIAQKYGYKKIIHIESDFFILSPRLKRFLATVNSGWISLYSDFYNLPESAIQIICEDQFEVFTEMRRQIVNANFNVADYAESIIPFTHVEKRFIGDRFGEELVLAKWIDMQPELLSKLDYFGQTIFPPNTKLYNNTANYKLLI